MFSLFISITTLLLAFSFKRLFFIQELTSSWHNNFLVGITSWYVAEDTQNCVASVWCPSAEQITVAVHRNLMEKARRSLAVEMQFLILVASWKDET